MFNHLHAQQLNKSLLLDQTYVYLRPYPYAPPERTILLGAFINRYGIELARLFLSFAFYSFHFSEGLRAPEHPVSACLALGLACQPHVSNGGVFVCSPRQCLRTFSLFPVCWEKRPFTLCALVARLCELRKSQAGSRNYPFRTS